VHVFFGISAVADMATGDGKQLRAFTFDRMPDFEQPSVCNWPDKSPSNTDFALSETVVMQLTRSNETSHQQLGVWIKKPHQDWKWFCSPSTTDVFHREEDAWERCA